jgi:hypothetical protein
MAILFLKKKEFDMPNKRMSLFKASSDIFSLFPPSHCLFVSRLFSFLGELIDNEENDVLPENVVKFLMDCFQLKETEEVLPLLLSLFS